MQNFILIPETELQQLNSKLDKLLSSKVNTTTNSQSDWLSNEDAMKFLMVSKSTLQTYRNLGYIKFSKVGRKLRYARTDLQEFLESNKVK